MTSGTGDGRTEPTAEREDNGQIWLAALVVLAIIASIIMLLTDSDTALKFALIAALWAAVIGFILVGRYRNQARSAKDELVLREQTLQAELEKARVEAEAASAAAAAAPSPVDLEVLEEIKRELAAVRAQLEELSGREFGFEPAALRAEARRIIELEARTYAKTQERIDALSQAPEQKPDEPVEAEVDELPEFDDTPVAPSPDAIAGRLGSQPSPRAAELNPLAAIITENTRRKEQEEVGAAKNPQDDPAPTSAQDKEPAAKRVSAPAEPEKKAQDKKVQDKKAQDKKQPEKKSPVPFPYADAADSPAARKAGAASKDQDPANDKKSEKSDTPEAAQKPTPDKTGKEARSDEKNRDQSPTASEKKAGDGSATSPAPKPQGTKDAQGDEQASATPAEPEHAPEHAAPEQTSGGGRRRRENNHGISVAELMANLKKEEGQDT